MDPIHSNMGSLFVYNTSATLTSTNPILKLGQIGNETDTGRIKKGDGVSTWSQLTYIEYGFEIVEAAGTDTYTGYFNKPFFLAYFPLQRIRVRFANANTGAATINLNSLGAIAIKKNVSVALAAGDILAGGIYHLHYDGTNFQLEAPANSSGAGTVTSVTGTLNRITSSGGTTPVIDIAATYVGQASITTLGTITTGVWTGTDIANANLANSTITIGATTIALGATSLTLAGLTSVTSTAFVGALTGNATTATTTTNIVGGTLGAIPYQSGVGTTALLAATATAGQMLRSGASAAPTWSTNTWANTTAINQILHATAANVIGGNANFLFDTVNTGLIVGTTALPATADAAYFYKNQNAQTRVVIGNNTSGTAGATALTISADGVTTALTLRATSAGYTTSGINVLSTAMVTSTLSGGINIGTISAAQLSLWTNNTEQARFLSTGEFLAGYSTLVGTESWGFQKNQNALTQLFITNTTSGTAGRTALAVGSTVGTYVFVQSLSAGYTSSGIAVATTGVVNSNMAGGLNIGTTNAAQLSFWTNNTKALEISSVKNMSLGGVATRATTVGTFAFQIFDGTAPVGTLANGCSFYSTTGEMRVMDAAGNATLLSPHEKKTNYWIYDSVDTTTGKRLKIDMEKMLRFLNDKFGTDFIHEYINQ